MQNVYAIEYEKPGGYLGKTTRYAVADSFNQVLAWFEAQHTEKLISIEQRYADVIVLPITEEPTQIEPAPTGKVRLNPIDVS